jgi:putative membrane protein
VRAWALALRPALLVAGLAVVAWLVYRIGPQAVWDIVRTLGWRVAVLLCFPSCLAVLLDAVGWRLLLAGHAVPFSAVVRARLAGEAVNLTTPTASVGGEPLKAYLLRPHVPLADGLASVVVDKTTVITGQMLLLIVGLAIALRQLPPSNPLVFGMALLLAVEVICIGGFIAVQTLGVFGGGARALGRLGVGSARRHEDALHAVDGSLRRAYREHRGRLVASALLHALAWASGGVEIYLLAAYLGLDASLAASTAIEAFGAAVKFASFIVPASVGALEGGYVAFFNAFGLAGAVALSYSLIRRLREAVWAAAGYLCLAAIRGRASRSAGSSI